MELHFKVFEEAKAPEAAALAREPPGVAGRAGVGAATPPGASWERNAQGRLQAASLSPRNMLCKRFFFFFSFVEQSFQNLVILLIQGKTPIVFSSYPSLGKFLLFPKGSKETGESSKGTRTAAGGPPLLYSRRPVGDLSFDYRRLEALSGRHALTLKSLQHPPRSPPGQHR